VLSRTREETNRRALILVAAALAQVAIMAGLVVAWITSSAEEIRAVGAGPAPGRSPAATGSPNPEATGGSPSTSSDTAGTGATASPPTASGPTAGPSGPSSPSPTTPSPPRPPATALTLSASPNSAGAFERVTLTGQYPGAASGTAVQVQRVEGGAWVEFPVTATVEGGAYTTYVELGQPGANRLRVVDPDSGATSNPVTVTVS
jgi:hypothetical protein